MITQTLQPKFGEKHKAYIAAATRATISVAEGAVRAGKTIDNIAAFAYLIEKGTPDRIHLATGSTAANAKLNIGDANGYGLEYLFRGRCRWTKYKGNEALVIRSHKRDYVVIFAGGAKADSFKKIRGNSYGMWIATEINLHHEDTIKEAFNRQLAARVRRVFWDLNPSAPGHWIYEHYIDKFPESMGVRYNYQHFTIRDNATITPQRLAEIEAQYDAGSIWYRRDILGERCIAEGLVYQFGEENITDVIPESGEYYISIDYGTLNPFSAGLWCVNEDKAVRIAEYYYSGRDMKEQKTDEEYCDEVEKLAGDRYIRAIVVDPSAASFITALRRRSGFSVRKANNDVLDGIRVTGRLLKNGKLKVHRSCKDAIREFGLYRWDDEKNSDQVIKENDHCLTGDTLVDTVNGQFYIKDLVGKTGEVYCTDGDSVKVSTFHDVRMTQKCADVYEIKLNNGKTVKATAEHPILTKRGWVAVKDLRGDDEIACIGGNENESRVFSG
jgi:PBSX family phage terminase large subunit